MKEIEYFASLEASVVVTDERNVMVRSEELIGTTEQLTLYMRSRINRCHYKCVRIHFIFRM